MTKLTTWFDQFLFRRRKVQEILRKVILESGAKWFITSSYPGSDTLKSDSSACTTDEMLGWTISRNWDTPLKINTEHNYFKWVIFWFHMNVPGWCLDEQISQTGILSTCCFFVWGFGGICETFRDGYSQSHDSLRIFTCNWLSLTKKQIICHLNFPTDFCELKFFCSSFHLKLHFLWVFVGGWFNQGIFSVARELCREAMVVGIPSLWIVHLFVFLRQTPKPSLIAPFLLKMPLGWLGWPSLIMRSSKELVFFLRLWDLFKWTCSLNYVEIWSSFCEFHLLCFYVPRTLCTSTRSMMPWRTEELRALQT